LKKIETANQSKSIRSPLRDRRNHAMEGPSYKHDDSPNYEVDASRRDSKRSRRPNRPEHTRGANRPIIVNGIHRRRNKRWTW
jgi:hypothetical protein